MVGIAFIIDMLLDQLLMPRVMGNSLQVHPAAIMISALVGAQLMGILGVILAAPAFATLKLFLRYTSRKLFDQDPWEGMQYYQKPKEPALLKGLRVIWAKIFTFIEKPFCKVRDWFKELFNRSKGKTSQNKN